MKKLIIFDLDGTLLDTVPDICDAVNVMLKEFGFPTITEEEARRFVGNGAKKLVERALKKPVKKEVFEDCYARFGKIYGGYKSVKTVVFPGVKDLLLNLRNSGIKTAVLTNKPQDAADTVLKQILGDFEFDIVSGQRDNIKCKPDPDETLRIISDLGETAGDVLFVGDGETDFLTAKNAGVECVSVLWGYRGKDFLSSFGAKNFAETPKDIKKFIF